MKRLYILVLPLILAGCGAGSIGTKLESNNLDQVFTTRDAPQGYATMFVYREARAATAMGTMRVFIDQVKVLELGNGSYSKIFIKPGKHEFKLRFYEDDYMSQEVPYDGAITADKTWLLMSDYFGETKKLVSQNIASLKLTLQDQFYQDSGRAVVSTINVTNEDHELWADFSGKNSVNAMDNFLYLYPYSPYAKDAQNRKAQLVKSETVALENASRKPGAQPLLQYLGQYPGAHNREQALKEAIKRSSNAQEMRTIYSKYPDSAHLMPARYRMEYELMNTGPEGMKVEDVAFLLNNEKLSAGIVSAKILASAGMYKDFSSEEIRYLQSKGVPSQVIESMINSNTKAQNEMKQAQKDEALMKNIKELIEKSQQQVSAQAVKSDGGNSTIECIKQQAALEACAQTTSGFFKLACDTTARASFSCTAI